MFIGNMIETPNGTPVDAGTGKSARLAAFGWILAFIIITSLLQWYIPYPLDNDTAYHFSVGQLIDRHGILYSFPWTAFSLQADQYADKEFLFHLLFLPFLDLGLVNGSRLVGIVAGTMVLTALHHVLRREGVTHPGTWTLVTLGTGIFIYRLSMVRPHLLSIALALLMLWAYLNGKRIILFVTALLYPLSYVAFWQLPLILVSSAEFARILSSRRIEIKLPVVVISGIVAGVFLHPNSLNLVKTNWLHMYDVLFMSAWADKTGVERLGECLPLSMGEWVTSAGFNAAFTMTALVLSWRNSKEGISPLAFAVAALIFGILTARSMRFSEYFVPFSVAAIALACGKYRKRFLAPAVLVIVLSVGSLYVLPIYFSAMRSMENKEAYIEKPDIEFLSENIPRGAQVFTCGVEYTGSLMAALPERYFMVAVEPVTFYRYDPELYDIWSAISVCSSANATEIVRTRFRSRYVICRNLRQHDPFFESLMRDPLVRNRITPRWAFFDLGAP